MTYGKIWNTLSSVDCNEHTDKKGGLTYLSWAWAWGILMEHFPDTVFEFGENEDHADGSMTVHCTVTIGSCQRSLGLPVMDYKNSAIKTPNSRDISDNKMRCLTKTLALFGLGHYIYAGEDTVHAGSNEQTVKAQARKPSAPPQQTSTEKPKQPSSLEKRMQEQKSLITKATSENIEEVMDFIFHTILNFSLPPEGATRKEGEPETTAGWMDRFTSSNGNKKTLVYLYNEGFKTEVKALDKRLEPIRALSVEELYKLLNEQKENENG
jgi:hypothetical protein